MQTKFILHGGYAGRPNPQNDAFFKEILKNAPSNTKILLIYFAKEENEYPRIKNEDVSQFEKNKGDKNISFEIASEDSLLRQIDSADVIYLHGGQTLKLLAILKKYPDLRKRIKGKIIVGESAGAYVLSSCYYSKTEGGIFKGLGFVSTKTICHYVGINREKLNKCPEGLEFLLLADYQYKVFQ